MFWLLLLEIPWKNAEWIKKENLCRIPNSVFLNYNVRSFKLSKIYIAWEREFSGFMTKYVRFFKN